MNLPFNAASTTVLQSAVVELVDAFGTSEIDATLLYDPADPYSATLRFEGGADSVSWTFARDLLAGGLFRPVGEGDVHVYPDLDDEGRAAVMVELYSPHGAALLRLSAREVNQFVASSVASVRPGEESAHLDVDKAISAMLAGSSAG